MSMAISSKFSTHALRLSLAHHTDDTTLYVRYTVQNTMMKDTTATTSYISCATSW